MSEDTRPLMVTIRCMTYNQELYIRQCLEGFVMQKTNFRFEAIVHDDASTDGTAIIIREFAEKYPDIIKPIFEIENQYSKHDGSLRRIMDTHMQGKYVAFCEGDDYWTDPLKLQKQVDLLEAHPEYGMCYTDFDICDLICNEVHTALFKNRPDRFPKEYTIEEWIDKTGYVAPMTWLVRRDLMLNIPNLNAIDGTFVMFAFFLYTTKVYCLDDVTAVYRIAWGSATYSTSLEKRYKRLTGIHDIKLKLIEMYLPLDKQNAYKKKADIRYLKSGIHYFAILGEYDKIQMAKQCLNGKISIVSKIILNMPQNKWIRRILKFSFECYVKVGLSKRYV